MSNEKRMIDYEQAKRATYEEIFWSESEQAVVRHFLAKLPKVDAVEVVHGNWTELKSMSPEYSCSECGQSYEWWEVSEAHYCPNCGAKMNKGV